MSASYDRRQAAASWPRKGKWSPDGLPAEYLELLRDLAANLTAWRREHDPGQRLDPRCDPRMQPRQSTTGGCHACD